MPLAIRAFTPADARAVAVIHVDGWRAAYRGAMPDVFLDALSVDQRTESWGRPLRHAEQRLWVAEESGEIVGFVLTGPSRDEGERPGVSEIIALYAAPARWGTGAGRALVAHVFADLAARGEAELTLWVLAANVRARRFYGCAGFRADGGEKTVSFGGAALLEVRYRATLGDARRPA